MAILAYFMGICANTAAQKWAEHRAGLPEIDPFLTNLCSTKHGSHIRQMTKRFELLSVASTGSNTFRFNSVRNSRFSLSLTRSGLPPHRLCGEYSRGNVPKVVANSRDEKLFSRHVTGAFSTRQKRCCSTQPSPRPTVSIKSAIGRLRDYHYSTGL